MKRFLILLAILFCSICHAETFNQYWYANDSLYSQTTCTTGGDINLPTTAPTKYGYDFVGWENIIYTPIEYLESTGTQWIDTGVILTKGVEFLARIGTNTVNVAGITGIVWQLNHHIVFRYSGSTDISSNQQYSVRTLYDIGFNIENKYFMVGNNKQTKTNEIGNTGVIRTGVHEMIASLKIWQDNQLVRDMVSVLDSNSTPCMYDRVTGLFFYNQGTDNFIAGPVISSGGGN